MTTRRMRIGCFKARATDIHLEYLILVAFPQQQCLRERAFSVTLDAHCLSY
jgi:hypothetical protein